MVTVHTSAAGNAASLVGGPARFKTVASSDGGGHSWRESPQARMCRPYCGSWSPSYFIWGKKPRPSVVVIATNIAVVNASASSGMVTEGPPAPPVSTLTGSTDPAHSLPDSSTRRSAGSRPASGKSRSCGPSRWWPACCSQRANARTAGRNYVKQSRPEDGVPGGIQPGYRRGISEE